MDCDGPAAGGQARRWARKTRYPGGKAHAAPNPSPWPRLEPEPQAAEPEAQPEPQLTAEQARKLAGYSAGGQRLLAERLAATREMLSRADDEHYALELFLTENTDPARMERFLLRARELVPLEELYVIPVAGGGDYRLLGGVRQFRQPRGGARRRPAPAAALPAGLPRRAAQLRRAPAAVVKRGKRLRDRRLRHFPQRVIVLSLPWEGVPRA